MRLLTLVEGAGATRWVQFRKRPSAVRWRRLNLGRLMEKLARDQVFPDISGAIHLGCTVRSARGTPVEFACPIFLAGAVFAVMEHRGGVGGAALDEFVRTSARVGPRPRNSPSSEPSRFREVSG